MLTQILRRGSNAVLAGVMLLTAAGPMMPVSTSAAPTEAGVYTEDFTTYTAKHYADNTAWDIWAHSLRLARSDAPSQSSPAVARDSNGNAVMVWTDDRNGDADIYARKLDASGNQLWAADVRVNSDSGMTWQAFPAVAIDGSGNAVIVWHDDRNGDYDIYAQKLDASGNRLWTADVRVNSDTGTVQQFSPAVAVDGSGNAVIVWEDYRNGDIDADIYAQKLDASGNRLWTADVRLNSDTGMVWKVSPTVAVDGSGTAVIVWQDNGGRDDIYAQKLDAGGNRLWTAEVIVNSYTGTMQGYPAVAVDGSGSAVIVWQNDSGFSNIYAQKLDADGNRLWAVEVRVNSDIGMTDQEYPAVAVDGSGKAVIVWEDGNYDVYAQKLDTSGNRLWVADVRVNSDSGTADQKYPAVAVDGSGTAVIVWEDYRNDNAAGDIYAQKLNASGNRLWPADVRVNSDSGTTYQYDPAVAVDGDGHAVIVWQDSRNGNSDIYAQKLDASGNRLWAADVRINSDSGTTDQKCPAIAVDGSGNAVIVWKDYRNDNAFADIYAQKLDASGNRLWAADARVNSYTDMTWWQRFIEVAVDGSGKAVIVWGDRFDNIYAQKLDASGNRLWAGEVRVSSDGEADDMCPAVAVDGSGNAVIVWEDNFDDIYAQKLDASGNKLWTADVRVNSDSGTAEQWLPAVAVDGSGMIVVAWQDSRNGNDIYAQKLDASGNRLWAADVRISSDTGVTWFQSSTKVAMDGSGNAVMVWGDYRNGNSDLSDIYAQKLNTNGSRLWTADVRVNSDSGTGIQELPAIAMDGSGTAVIAWGDYRNGNADIYAQKVNSVGGKVWLADLQVVYPDLFYFPTGIAQSRTIDTVVGNIRQATLTANYQLNSGSVQFYLTNNGGANWFTATLGTASVFTTTGSDLRWRAVLTGDPVWRQRSPIVTSLRIEYSAQISTADDYEPDNDCTQARPIAVNGAAQAHTFHQYADADWVWFDVISSTTYILQTANPQINADTTLELRPSCLQPPLGADDNVFGHDARITWRATFTGRVYARAANHSTSIFGADTGYDLSVRTYTQPPVVVIVGGHDNGYTLQPNIDYASDLAYRTLLNSGVPKANIRYFSPNPNRDVDSNGLNDDIFATATITNVRDAVQDWSRIRGVSVGVPFYLYLVDHGYYDQFLAAGSTGRVFAEHLNLWLSNLEATNGADNINVILEACKSGSFIDVTTLGPNQISGRNRVVIASTSSMLDAYPRVAAVRTDFALRKTKSNKKRNQLND